MADDDREAAERVRRLFSPVPYRPGLVEALAVAGMTALAYQFVQSTSPDIGIPTTLLLAWMLGQGSVEIVKGAWKLCLKVAAVLGRVARHSRPD
jgi:hypothetical protein